jgi:hypothetical protein
MNHLEILDSHGPYQYVFMNNCEELTTEYNRMYGIIKAYNNHPLVQQLLNDKILSKTSNWSSKWLIYRDIWPDLVQRVKLTGLEGDKEPGICLIRERTTRCDRI